MKLVKMSLLGLVLLMLSILLAPDSYLESCCPRGGTPPPPSNPTPSAPSIIRPRQGAPLQAQGQPPSATPRPPLAPGLEPLIQTVFAGGSSLSGVVEPWEIWWSRSRAKYLAFREQIQWLKAVDTGGTTNIQLFPTYNELIKILCEAVGDKNQYVAFRAAVALGKAQDSTNLSSSSQAAIDALKKAHESEPRIFIRDNILLGLGLSGDASCLPTILDVLKNKSGKEIPLRRCYAAVAAGYFNSDEVIKALKESLSDKEHEVRCCACISLGNLKDTASIPVLGRILNTAEGDRKEASQTRAFAALGLGRIGGKDALNELKKYLATNDRDGDIHSAVAIALGVINLPDAKESLVSLLQDKNFVVRGLAALSLGQLKDTKSYDIISEALQKNKSSDADGLMLVGLALTGDEKAKDDLRKVLDNKKARPLLKASAAIGLGLLKDAKAVPAIVGMLSDEKQQNDLVLTPYLILALGMIQDPRGTEVLQKMWEKADRNVSMVAYTNLAVALTMLGKRPDVIKAIIDHIKSKDAILGTYALHTLGLVGDKESSKIFIDTYKNNDNPEIHKAAVEGIGFMLDKNTINPLDKVIADNIDVPMQIMNHILPIPVW